MMHVFIGDVEPGVAVEGGGMDVYHVLVHLQAGIKTRYTIEDGQSECCATS